MGNNEPVTPILPNSDYWQVLNSTSIFFYLLMVNPSTGVAGVSGILRALMLQAEKGGSYSVGVRSLKTTIRTLRVTNLSLRLPLTTILSGWSIPVAPIRNTSGMMYGREMVVQSSDTTIT